MDIFNFNLIQFNLIQISVWHSSARLCVLYVETVPTLCILYVRTVPTLCILNVGTVPTLCVFYVGTVPMLCILDVGTVPTLCILNVGTVPIFSSSELVPPQWPPQPCRQWAQLRRGPKIVNFSCTEGCPSPSELVLPQLPPQPCRQRAQRRRGPKIALFCPEVYIPQMVQVYFPCPIPGVPVFFPDFFPVQPTIYI